MVKKLSLYTLLLCLVPIFLWATAYQWQGDSQFADADFALYLLTETGSVPYALITCGVFALLFRFLFADTKQWLLGVAVMAFAVVLTQGVKSGLKSVFAEPRPFTVYLAEQTGTQTADFYAEARSRRAEIVQQFYSEQPQTPSWLRHHYENETGYAFPSGHTIFAATWLFLAVGFTRLFANRSRKAQLLVGGTAIWAVLMLISRVRFGMHYPIDLFAAVIVAFPIHLIIFRLLDKKAIFIKKTHPHFGYDEKNSG